MTGIRIAVLILLVSGGARLGLAQERIPVEVAVPSFPKIPPGSEESGDVQIEVSISPSGDVTEAKAVSGPQRLRTAAVLAAKRWRFRPLETPTAAWVITFSFIYRAGIGDPPSIASLFKPPNRVEVYALERKVVVIEDPPVGVVKKNRK
jgi:TonB family protein